MMPLLLVILMTNGPVVNKGIERLDRPDGITLIVAEDHSLPRVAFRVALRAGGSEDPEALQGLTRVLSELALRGTQKHSRRAFNELVEGYGSSLSGDSSSESQTWGGEALTRYFEATFALLAEATQTPALAKEELDKLVREMEAERTTRKDDDSTLARLAFRRALFGPHVYGRDPLGTKASLAAITPEALRAELKRRLVRGNMIFAAAGDVSLQGLSALVDKYFAAIPAGESLRKEVEPTPEAQGITLYVVDKPERTQTQIILGRPALKGTNPDHLAMNVATTAFGGTFTAPLMHEIREVRGWSYGAYASVAELRGRGGFSMVSAPATADTAACIELMVELYKKYWNGEYPESLFEFARSYMSNQYPFSVATADARVSEYLHAELMGYPDNWVPSYPARLAALRVAEIKAMPKRYLSDTDFIIVIVASYKELKTALAGLSFSPEIKVLPIGSEP